ncbi:MAG: DinB family protein, partial [Nitrolancea sp.]
MIAHDAGFASREVASFWRFITSSLNWRPPAPEANSLYALAIHTFGTVEENVVEILGGQPVNRQREAEFQAAGPSTAAIQQRWETLRPNLEAVLTLLTHADLQRTYSHPRRGEITGLAVLIVVARHTAEHLG